MKTVDSVEDTDGDYFINARIRPFHVSMFHLVNV